MSPDQPKDRPSEKRVLAVVRHPVGGVRTHILYTYPLLAREGYRFTFVVPAIEHLSAFREEVSSWEGAEVVDAPMTDPYRSKCRFFSTVRRLLRERRFTLVHTHGLYAAAQVTFANLGFGLPHVVTSQDVFEHVPVSRFVGRLKLFVLGRVLSRVDALVAVSDDTREDHLRYLPALKKSSCRVVTIHNGIDVERFASPNGEPPVDLRGRLGIGADVYLLGFLGRFMKQKGFLVLVDALSELIRRPPTRPFHLVAVGSGDFELNYKAHLADKPELLGRISFLEHTPNVAPILRELNVLIIPSLWEAHPLLPMEAMLAGIPILGSNCIGLREVLRGSPSVMVSPNDSRALAQAIRDAIGNPWKEEAASYVPTAKQRFDVTHTAKKLLSLFEELTAQKSRVDSSVPEHAGREHVEKADTV